jgi:hypothetical protein
LAHRDIEFLGDDLSKCRAYAGAQIDVAAIDRDCTVSVDGEERIDGVGRKYGRPPARERRSIRARQHGRQTDGHHQGAAYLQELSAVGRVSRVASS